MCASEEWKSGKTHWLKSENLGKFGIRFYFLWFESEFVKVMGEGIEGIMNGNYMSFLFVSLLDLNLFGFSKDFVFVKEKIKRFWESKKNGLD